ncbi:LRR 8 domain containing protein [Asbolus verrucosus]|uniref:LRR 8 domain containing protein n=1 Tax=Asbolus verrucosus TaxID=1661398 RepID=A0A482UZL7_ASBVE|nr:LRR 8 domain containing protein [Asbolus verrucosus]
MEFSCKVICNDWSLVSRLKFLNSCLYEAKMLVRSCFKFFAVFLTIPQFCNLVVNCATYENVTLTLTTRWTIYFVDYEAPIKLVPIRSDNNLVDYVNNQPFEIVQIQNQIVPELAENSVANLPNINEIQITRSGVRNVLPGAFRNLPSLKYLDLSDNLLEEIKDGVFTDLPELDLIHLENNRISRLGDKVFNSLPRMNHLFISNNSISTWRSHWFSETRVESIAMGYNLLEELPANAFEYYVHLHKGDDLVRLWYLELNDNKLKKIHPDAFQGLTEVGYLNLHNNSLQELPSGIFRTVKNLNNFVLSDNKIIKIDVAQVFKNTTLTYVELNNNQLSCVSVDIFNFVVNCATYKNVTLMLTSRWTIYSVSDSALIKFVAIRSDNTIANYVNNQPMDVVKKSISLESNKISKLDDRLLNSLSKMSQLFLNHNRISARKSLWFSETLVEAIHIGHNLLQELPCKLKLNDNNPKTVHLDAFEGLTEIGYLKLRNNSVKVDNKIVKTDVTEMFKNTMLTHLGLKNNRLLCLPADANITMIQNLNYWKKW